MTSADGVRVMRALGHPLRLAIFDLISRVEAPVSARQIQQSLEDRVSLGLVAFHVGNLEAAGLLVAARVEEHGRAREQYFALSHHGHAVKPQVAALLAAATRPPRR